MAAGRLHVPAVVRLGNPRIVQRTPPSTWVLGESSPGGEQKASLHPYLSSSPYLKILGRKVRAAPWGKGWKRQLRPGVVAALVRRSVLGAGRPSPVRSMRAETFQVGVVWN